MIASIKRNLLYIGLGIIAVACNLTQEVDLDLPEYEAQIVIESYLEPGQPYFLTMVESSGYFDNIELDYVRDATVTIEHEGLIDTLQPIEIALNTPGIDLLLDTGILATLAPIIGQDLYVYGSLETVPASYNTDFTLRVSTQDGQQLQAVTQIPEPIDPLPTMEYRFNDDSMAFVLTTLEDKPGTVDFYRRVLEVREPEIIVDSITGTSDTTWVSDEEQDFTVDDEIANGGPIVFGTGFDYEIGDTLINTLYHITSDYYRFTATRDAAIQASFSPFGQPAVVYSNVEGGMGIFTGFSRVQTMIVVGE